MYIFCFSIDCWLDKVIGVNYERDIKDGVIYVINSDDNCFMVIFVKLRF